MVLGLVSSIASFTKVQFLSEKAVIDNFVFRLHYRLTAGIMFLGCILCTANSFIGEPIQCIHGTNSDETLDKAINSFCWITTTHTIPVRMQNAIIGKHLVAPGVGPEQNEDERRYHTYYQWVPFVLFLQGVLFYLPHWLWKNFEEGTVKSISDGLRGAEAVTKEERIENKSRLVNYFLQTMSSHNWYAAGYFVAEFLNFFNVILNIFFTDKFLGGTFLKLGFSTVNLPMESEGHKFDPLHLIFPRITKCTFHRYGPSGTPMKEDALCVLALNIINEKIYIFLWFWFIILAVISGLAFLYSVAIIVLPLVRRQILARRFKFRVTEGVSTLVQQLKVGDFMLLHFLGQNINSMLFKQILEELADKLSYTHQPSSPSKVETPPLYPNKELFPSH